MTDHLSLSVAHRRLWTVGMPGPPIRPDEVIWEAASAPELLAAAAAQGYVVRGPYVLESPPVPVGAKAEQDTGERPLRGLSGGSRG